MDVRTKPTYKIQKCGVSIICPLLNCCVLRRMRAETTFFAAGDTIDLLSININTITGVTLTSGNVPSERHYYGKLYGLANVVRDNTTIGSSIYGCPLQPSRGWLAGAAVT